MAVEVCLLLRRDVMNRLACALEGQEQGWPGAKYVRIDGATDAIDRRTAVQRFRDDATVSVALLSITAAGKTPSVVPSGKILSPKP